jgi:hypothetical protein
VVVHGHNQHQLNLQTQLANSSWVLCCKDNMHSMEMYTQRWLLHGILQHSQQL